MVAISVYDVVSAAIKRSARPLVKNQGPIQEPTNQDKEVAKLKLLGLITNLYEIYYGPKPSGTTSFFEVRRNDERNIEVTLNIPSDTFGYKSSREASNALAQYYCTWASTRERMGAKY